MHRSLLVAIGALVLPLKGWPQTPAPAKEPILESTRSAVRSTAQWLASGVDSWFGDRPFEEGGKVSDGTLSVGLLHRRDQGTDVNVRFNARLRLPNLESGAYLFLGREDRRDVVTDKPATFSQQQRLIPDRPEDLGFVAGIGLAPSDSLGYRLGFRGGLKPYAQVRYRKPWTLSARDLLEFRQTLFWSVDDHVGATAALSFEHAVSSTLATRWLNSLTITQVSKKFEWSSSLGAYKDVGAQRLLAVEVLANGRQGSGVNVIDYGVQTRWEQPLHKDWLLGEVVIGHFWPRPDDLVERSRVWALGATLKMRF